MAYPVYVREKACQLRVSAGLTIDQLSERLAIPRTTVYYWVKDLPIAPTRKQTAAARRAGQVTSAIHRRRRAAAREQGRREFRQLAREPTFRDFVCMYIGEGTKRNRNAVAICNSNPQVVLLGSRWIRRLSSRPTTYSFQHHADQDPDELRAYWGMLLDVDASMIKFQRKSNSGRLNRRTWRSRYGVLQVRTADTYLRARLDAWMEQVQSEWP